MEEVNVKRFEKAVSYVTPIVKNLLLGLPDGVKAGIREIRMRSGLPVIVINQRGANFLNVNGRLSCMYGESAVRMNAADINDTFNRICGYSVHSHKADILNGFITIEGGHRAGICGTAVSENNAVTGIRDISSINLRIAGEYKGVADEIVRLLFSESLCGLIVAGSPASGKTTFLRDLARQLSNGSCDACYKTVVIDEREEIAAVWQGVAQNDIGWNCDVLNAYPKGEAILTALRCLSPEMIICDEVCRHNEIDAIESGVNAGVKFAVSVHAASRDDIINRPQIKRLLATGAFDYLLLLKGPETPSAVAEIYETGDLVNEICRCDFDHVVLHPGGTIRQQEACFTG